MMEKRTISAGAEGDDEKQFELSLRPKWLREYIGQHKAKENLSIFIQAARKQMHGHTLRRHAATLATEGRTTVDEAMKVSSQLED